jgi:hypothetical protein
MMQEYVSLLPVFDPNQSYGLSRIQPPTGNSASQIAAAMAPFAALCNVLQSTVEEEVGCFLLLLFLYSYLDETNGCILPLNHIANSPRGFYILLTTHVLVFLIQGVRYKLRVSGVRAHRLVAWVH